MNWNIHKNEHIYHTAAHTTTHLHQTTQIIYTTVRCTSQESRTALDASQLVRVFILSHKTWTQEIVTFCHRMSYEYRRGWPQWSYMWYMWEIVRFPLKCHVAVNVMQCHEFSFVSYVWGRVCILSTRTNSTTHKCNHFYNMSVSAWNQYVFILDPPAEMCSKFGRVAPGLCSLCGVQACMSDYPNDKIVSVTDNRPAEIVSKHDTKASWNLPLTS